MRSNKRTVWFLTLLSLVAVLSIYYLNKNNPMPLDGIAIFGDEPSTTISSDESKKQPVFAESYLFEEMRMEIRNERSQLQEQLSSKLTNASNSEEMNETYDEMEKLVKQQSAENLLEMQIKALGYTDAFVLTEDGVVTVTVLSEEGHSSKKAGEITHLVMSNLQTAKKVTVEFKDES